MRAHNLTLNDGRQMPQLGFGSWQVEDDEAEAMALEAFRLGYRAVDTAAAYRNEAGIGRAIAKTDVPRDEIFVTTKLFNTDQGYDTTMVAFDASMQKLGLETLDLYLIHWPSPRRNLYVETWKALIRLQRDGRVKSIGVSNFNGPHLQRLIAESGVVPAVNQIEAHPRFQQRDLRAIHAKLGIITQSWSPLGQGTLLAEHTLSGIAHRLGRTPAQVLIRWHLDNGLSVIPKTATPSRLAENFDVFDFTLDAAAQKAIAALDTPKGRMGPDPDTASF